MITLIISASAACGTFAALHFGADLGVGWSVFWGLVAFGVIQAVSGLLIQRRVKGDMAAVQAILESGQKRLQQKMQRWQIRPPGSMKSAQKEIADDTRIFVTEALARTEELRRYRLWVPMVERQIATAQLQLNWMIRDFKSVDRLMPKAMLIDPTMAAMKMARMQMLDAPIEEITKLYNKSARRLKYNQNVLIAACYSWILVKRNLIDDAFKALTEALKNSDNETLKRNHECLMNNRTAHFSNSGIGDTWYSLMLEEPKVRAQRQHMQYR